MKGNGVSWGGARFKGKGRECELTKKMFFHSDLVKLCLRKKRKINEFFPQESQRRKFGTTGVKLRWYKYKEFNAPDEAKQEELRT